METTHPTRADDGSARITQHIGMLLRKDRVVLPCVVPVRMPCGFVVVPPEAGWPTDRDVPCPCGNPSHVALAWVP